MGLLVVDRTYLLELRKSSRSLSKVDAAVRGTDAFIFQSYEGFDGQSWPGASLAGFTLFNGLAPAASYHKVRAYYEGLVNRADCDLIALNENPDVEGVQFTFVGYDVGYYESEHSHFSALLNEVVFGTTDEMRRVAADLNEHLLLESAQQAEALLDLRISLLSRGLDLESDGDFEIISIYSYADTPRRDLLLADGPDPSL